MNNPAATEKKTGAKELIGVVSSTAMSQTVIVKVVHLSRHPMYKKTLKRRKSYAAHVSGMALAVGDTVRIREIRPISKTKHFVVVEKLG